jgi:hypothetical protein
LKGNELYDNNAGGRSNLPLDGFFTALRNSGIGVTPAQIAEANKLVLQFAPLVPNEAALCQHLCPLFATNQAGQERFKEIFAEQFAHKESLPMLPPTPKKQWWKYIVLLLLAVFLIGFWLFRAQLSSSPPDINLVYKITGQYSGNSNSSNDTLQFVAGDTLQASINMASGNNNAVELRAVYDWDDQTQRDTIGQHIYRGSGLYTIKTLVDVFYKKEWLRQDTNETVVKICNFDNGLAITTDAANDSVALMQSATFRINFDSPQPPCNIIWTIQGDADTGFILRSSGGYPQKREQDFVPQTEGSYMVSCELQYDSTGSICTYKASRLVFAYDPNKPQVNAVIQASPNAQPLIPKYKVKPYWFFLLGGGLLGFMLLGRLFNRLNQRLKRTQQETPLSDKDYQEWLAAFASTQPPGDVPFLNKNQYAPPEHDMLHIGRMMRRRIEGEAQFLHIGKTIGKAVRNNGFFQPVMAPRTHQGEYLFLIEESHINSQQTKLFDYLADTLRRYNVFVEKYYYRYEPSLCYNAATPNGIGLDKLSEKYPNHVLAIAGHCHQLIYPYQPMVSHGYQNILARWQHKAILTPLPYPDWGQAEKNILPAAIPVFPADIAGQMLMMQAFADSRMDVQGGLQEQAHHLYEAAELDAEDLVELADYCGLAEWAHSRDGNPYNNILFQWIAALAVYPKLQWELILAIGKTLLDTAGQGHQLNYTNLLRLVRLKWMREGVMPPALRLELLKKLSRPNEVMTRETILAALREIPSHDVKPGHAAYEEMETQRIINEFNLYAYHPAKYALYARSKNIFERLWEDKKVMEAAVKKYLRNENKQWPTLINSRLAGNPEAAASISLEDYFKPLPPVAKGLAKVYQNLQLLSSMLVGFCVLGLLGLLVLSFSNTKRYPLFTKQKKQLHAVTFIINDSTTNMRVNGQVQYTTGLLNIDSVTRAFDSSLVSLSLPVNDSLRALSVTVNNKPALDTLLTIDKNSYSLTLRDRAKEAVPIRVVFNLGPDCGDNLQTMSRYQLMAASVTTGIKVIMGPNSGKRNNGKTCVNAILVGNGVDEQIVRKLMVRFKQDNIELTRKPATEYGIPDGEIVITSLGEKIINIPDTIPQPVVKPLVYLQVSDADLLASAEAFRKRLTSKGYEVIKAEVMNWAYNSEIYYFDKTMEQSAQVIAALYQSFYPALPLKANKRRVNNPKPNDNRIVIWMKRKMDTINVTVKPPPDDTIKPSPVKEEPPPVKQETYDLGETILELAAKEIDTGENPPGSNKTKYGEWYDYKLNASTGIPWSALFVSWVYKHAGVPIGNDGRGFASYTLMLNYCKQKNWLTTEPVPGDIFIMSLNSQPSDDKKAKTKADNYTGGIFTGWTRKANQFTTIEGNISIGKDPKGTVGRGTRNSKDQTTYFIHIPAVKKAAAQ